MEVTEAAERYLDHDEDPEVYDTLARASDANGRDFFMLSTCLRQTLYLSMVPDILKRIIKKGAWKKWKWIDSEFHAESLADYLTKHPPRGLGVDLLTVEKLIKDDPEAYEMFSEAVTGEKGRPPKGQENHDNIMIKASQGTSKQYTLRRLKKERPDLYKKVVAGKLSANAAAKKAGWRPQKTPLDKLRSNWKAASSQEREIFAAEILNP